MYEEAVWYLPKLKDVYKSYEWYVSMKQNSGKTVNVLKLTAFKK
jgi:hypothetical protein